MNLHLRNILFGGALLLIPLVIAILTHFNGLYGQDGYEYLRLSRALSDDFRNGTPVSHSFFPILYPFAGFLFSGIIWNDIASLQAVSMVALAISFLLLKKLLDLLYDTPRFLNAYLICFFFLSPYVLRFGLLVMSDLLCMMCVLAATYFSFRFEKKERIIDAVLAMFFSSCAVATRYAVLLLVLFPLMMVFKKIIQRKDWRAFIFSTIALMIPLLPDLLLRHRFLFLDLNRNALAIDYASNAYSWSPVNFFKNVFENADGFQKYNQWNIAYALFNIFHPAYLFAGVIFIFFLRKKDFQRPGMKILSAMVMVYALFLAGLRYQSTRYLLQSFPMVLLIFYPAFERIMERFFPFKNFLRVAFMLIAVFQFSLFILSSCTIYEMNQSERKIASALKEYPGQTVYTCSINGALEAYGVNNPITDLYSQKVDAAIPNSLLLFNTVDFPVHFKDHNPMINFQFLDSSYHLNAIENFPGGWKLFRIEER